MATLRASLNPRGFHKYKHPEHVVDHLIIGAGVVGLAVAARFAQRYPDKSTYLVERHPTAGQELSEFRSNSWRYLYRGYDPPTPRYIHRFDITLGFYYPPESLKARLCLRGRHLLYERCDKYSIPYRKVGKLVVARKDQLHYIQSLHAKARNFPWPWPANGQRDTSPIPTTLISGDEARGMEPDLSKDIAGALWSPETGIIDTHAFMESLEQDIIDSESGELAYSTSVVRVDPYRSPNCPTSFDASDAGWVVQTVTKSPRSNTPLESDSILARTLINASGLSAPFVLNSLSSTPAHARIPIYYARGSYASYHGSGTSSVSHLIYPCPDSSNTSFQSLGTHLTLDLAGRIRFGPDLEWISPQNEDSDNDIDFWERHLVPDESRMHTMLEAVRRYLPNVTSQGMNPDYVGVRPKLVGPGGGFQDFIIRLDHSDSDSCVDLNHSSSPPPARGGAMVTLLGIESPGLTSSLALAEMIDERLLGRYET